MRLKMKPNNRPRRLTDVFVPFTNLAAAVREKLRGLRNLPNNAAAPAPATTTKKKQPNEETKNDNDALKTKKLPKSKINSKKRDKSGEMKTNAKTADSTGAGANQHQAEAAQTSNNSSILQHAVQRIPSMPKKTFIAFKAVSKKRRKRRRDQDRVEADVDIRQTGSTAATATAAAAADKKTTVANSQSDAAATATDYVLKKRKRKNDIERRKNFLGKMKRLRDIDTVIQKRSGGIKFTSTSDRTRNLLTSAPQPQPQLQPQRHQSQHAKLISQ